VLCLFTSSKKEEAMSEHGLTTSNGNLVESSRTGKMPRSVTMFLSLVACVWLGTSALSTAQSEDKTAPSEIRAQKFVVVDDNGKELAEFGIGSNGQPSMAVWNKGKSMVASMGMDNAGMPRFAFEKSSGEPLLELGVMDGRFPVFFLRNDKGERRLGMVVADGGSVGIGLYDRGKRDRCMLSLRRDGHPQITLKDDKGKVRASITLDDEGTCALDLLNRKEQERIVFQVDAQGQADAAVFGPDGKATWSAGKP